jgi:hypothetical protein
MFRRWLECLIVVLVAALVLNSQCYATCAISACQPSNHRCSHCHLHPEKGNRSDQACQHQHSQFLGPQDNTDLAKFAALQFSGTLALPCTVAIPTFEVQPVVEIVKRSGHAGHLGTSVLALVSTFRI